MSNNNKTILITGGAGFIGSHTAEIFLKKFKVIIFDNLSGGNLVNIKHLNRNKNFRFFKVDLLDIKKLKKFKK